MTDHIPFRERITCTIATAAEASGISTRKLYRLFNDGAIATVKRGDQRLVNVRSLRAYLGDDPPAGEGGSPE
jgi:excisionase family DNA binding protein